MKLTRKNILTLGIILVILVAIVVLEKTKTVKNLDRKSIEESIIKTKELTEDIAVKEKKYERAKEITTPDAIINADEDFLVEPYIGDKIILVDFWTYSCINCQRTLPYLNAWHDTYADEGLLIVGLHTPEFAFEEKYENVLRAVEKWEIEYPVVMDNDRSTWQSYNNKFWPRKYLIDVDGFIVYDHIGEGAYEETEEKIVELINERNARIGRPLIAVGGAALSAEADKVDFSSIVNRESYLGSRRIEFSANDQNALNLCLKSSAACTLEAPESIPVGSFAFDGQWRFTDESASPELVGSTIELSFIASNVNLVMAAPEPQTVTVYLDGELHKKITVEDDDLYVLVDLEDTYEEHELTVEFNDIDIETFAFTFG